MFIENSESLNREILYLKYRLVYYSKREEALNCITHALGAVLGFIVLGVLLFLSNSSLEKVAGVISGVCIFFPYANSAIYHGLKNLKLKSLWRRIDHSSICFIIIACAAPMLLCVNFTMFTFISLCIAFGVCLINTIGCLINIQKFSKIALVLDFLVALLFTAAYFTVKDFLSLNIKLCYIFGAATCLWGMIFYSLKKKYMHTVFHILMVAGTFIFGVASYLIFIM